jgi:hypothetical protein
VFTCERSDASSGRHAHKFVGNHVAPRKATVQRDTARDMVLELHVWGPAFGLPSIEPECIATIAYCQRVIPKGEWTLVAEHNPTIGATGTELFDRSGRSIL